MKKFPFKILFISIFLPPICYMLTIQVLEGYLQKREASKLNDLMIQNYEALYEGRYPIKEEINRNLGKYLSRSFKYPLGVRTHILVTTKDSRILYPAQFTNEIKDASHPPAPLNYVEMAAENYKILNDGLRLSVDLRIKHNSWLSNSILVSYVFLFLLILLRYVKKGIRETQRQETEQKELISQLSEQLDLAESGLGEIKAKENNYLKKIAEFKKDKKDLSQDINGLLEEMETLEAGLKTQRNLKEEMEIEVLELKEDLDRLKGKLSKPKKKKKLETTSKRFNVLYKNMVFTHKAIEGFFALTDDFQIKAEEVIHRLNEDDSQVHVKRKVFGKGGKMNILEVDFSYSGRLYFKKDSQAKTRVLAIGTKNTQDHDLSYVKSVG